MEYFWGCSFLRISFGTQLVVGGDQDHREQGEQRMRAIGIGDPGARVGGGHQEHREQGGRGGGP